MSDQAKFCATCGVELQGAGDFCGTCGTSKEPEALTPDHSDAEQPQADSSRSNKKAIWSLVAGLVGLFVGGVLFGGLAIYLSLAAKKEMASSGEDGAGIATAGLVLGIVSIVVFTLWRVVA